MKISIGNKHFMPKEPDIGLIKYSDLPYVHLETAGPTAIRSFQPTRLPRTWVGIADLEVMQALTEGLGIVLPRQEISQAQASLIRRVQEIFGQATAIVDACDLRLSIKALSDRIAGDNNPATLIISLDPLIAAGHPSLHSTRLICPKTKQLIGYGPRPGHFHIEEQLQYIRDQHPKAETVILTDDVLFTAGSQIQINKTLQEYGLSVGTSIIGVATEQSLEALRGQGIAPVPLVVVDDYIDIVDLRDLIGSAPLGGRVVGRTNGNGAQPVLDRNGISFRVPYLRKDGDPVDWASIPPKHAREFSIHAWQITDTVFEEIERSLGRTIVLSDLLRATIPAGFPGLPPKHMQDEKLNPEYPLREVLKHKHRKAQIKMR